MIWLRWTLKVNFSELLFIGWSAPAAIYLVTTIGPEAAKLFYG